MKKNAFTLVELLAVIVILSIIIAIVATNVFSIYEDSKDSGYSKQVELIKSTVKEYVIDNKRELFQSNDTICIDIKTLVRNKYLKEVPTDTRDDRLFSENFGFAVTRANNTYTYEQVEDVTTSQLCNNN